MLDKRSDIVNISSGALGKGGGGIGDIANGPLRGGGESCRLRAEEGLN